MGGTLTVRSAFVVAVLVQLCCLCVGWTLLVGLVSVLGLVVVRRERAVVVGVGRWRAVGS